MKLDKTQNTFELHTHYTPGGDQPNAIASLTKGLQNGLRHQTLLGVTGSGKTYTVASVIQNVQRPTLILAHNKTLAAQLYAEMKKFFPKNAVEYFVSYYDYYQPEAYVPASDTYIKKDSSINEHIEQMRLSATKAILQRQDVIIIATVSAIYGLGDPDQYMQMLLHLKVGEKTDQRSIVRRLSDMQYHRNNIEFSRGIYRVRGEVIDVFPADSDRYAIRVELFDDEIESIKLINPLTGKVIASTYHTTIFPSTHYVSSKERQKSMIKEIQDELRERVAYFQKKNLIVEAQLIEKRTLYDIEMIRELGYCTGIENYSRLLSARSPGEPPPTLLDYLPKQAFVVIDESHVTIPQFHGMYKGDLSRKKNLVNYGFRLPSALDNRPLKFHEFEALVTQAIYVSATPSNYEKEHQQNIAEQIVRPTGLLDPIIEVRSVRIQVEDALSEINKAVSKNERILITTLTKRMAESLTDYLAEHGVNVRYIHGDIDTVERVEIIRDLRMGIFDVIVGINLLREGLDMPEVSTVLIFDADKEGFLRSERSLIQTIGRAARHINGKGILYAEVITKSMQSAIDETLRRRNKQMEFNNQHGITPTSIKKKVSDLLELSPKFVKKTAKNNLSKKIEVDKNLNIKEALTLVKKLEKSMKEYARNHEFEQAGQLRDKIKIMKEKYLV